MAQIEDRLKQYIKTTYGSIRSFVLAKNLNYANVDSILRRGIKNATWNSVKSLCEALEISVDELAEDKIVPLPRSESTPTKIEDLFDGVKQQLLNADCLTLDGVTVSTDEIMLLVSTLDVALEVAKKQHKG